MLLSHVILCALMIACDALSIGTVTEKIKEPDAEGSDFFPDWVPFKNKHGEDLGEFVQVPKAKLKKRLALPVNFVLRAVAEPEGDDYLDKGQGESDNEEYYEKKDWSDAQRAAQPAGPGAATNHTEISDIDGVVEIITKKPDTPTVKANNNFVKPESKEKVEKEESTEEKVKDDNKTEENKSEEVKKEDTVTKVDDDSDYDETSSENPKTDIKDQTESEAKKAKILSSVDELKERHAEEQRLISEKVKEEEIFKEERERENLQRSSEEDKYTPKKKLNSIEPDYEEEYDETDSSLDEKYHVTTSTTSSTAATPPQQTTKRKGKNIQIGKLSVFKNPDLFTVGNENDVESSTTLRPTHTWPATKDTTEKYSAKYRAATPAEDTDEIERISLLPENDTDSEEPTLFFPKKTKNRRRKTKTTTPATDSSVAESVADKTAKHLSTTVDTGSSATIAVTAEAASLPEHGDAVSASTHNDKQEEKTEDYDNERGGGRDYHSHREEDHEEHGKKAYEVRNWQRRDKELSRKSVASFKMKPWVSMKIRRPQKDIVTKRIIMVSTTTTAASRRNITTSPDTTAPTTTKNTGKSMPSTKSPESMRKDTAQKAATTFTRKKNMKRKLSSLRKKVTPARKRSMVDTTKRENIRRVAITRRVTWSPDTTSTPRAIPDISSRADTSTFIRVTRHQAETTGTAAMDTTSTTRLTAAAGRSGCTTTDTPRRQLTWSS